MMIPYKYMFLLVVIIGNKTRAIDERLPCFGDRSELNQGSHRQPFHDFLLNFEWYVV
ncbi:hypothetical protein HanIR_Chr14g0720391 [Helianthus annuus]|nr:hypothetical protein HanIR_Chr14g0720391 [Helianthus annuus]